MSFEVSAIVKKRIIGSPTLKSILLYMADFASDDGSGVWVSKANIAKDLEITSRAVQINIKKLLAMSILFEVKQRKFRYGFTVEYRISLEKVASLKPTRDKHLTPEPRSPLPPDTRTTFTPTPEPRSPLPLNHVHPNLYKSHNKNIKELSKDSSKKPHLQEAFDLWNKFSQEVGLSQALKLTPSRVVKLKARLKDCDGIDGWTKALEQIRGSSFLLGDNNRGWKIDFDSMLQEKTFLKLLEGSYSGSRKPQKQTLSGYMRDLAAQQNEVQELFQIEGKINE